MKRARLEAPDFETAHVYLSYLAARAEIPESVLMRQLASGEPRIVLATAQGKIVYEHDQPWIWVEGEPEWVSLVLEDDQPG